MRLNGRFAAFIADARPDILRTFTRRFNEKYGFIPENGAFRERALATASGVISDVVCSVPGGARCPYQTTVTCAGPMPGRSPRRAGMSA